MKKLIKLNKPYVVILEYHDIFGTETYYTFLIHRSELDELKEFIQSKNGIQIKSISDFDNIFVRIEILIKKS